MPFMSFEFVVLLMLCFILYYSMGNRYKQGVLLLSSFIFIGYYNWAFLLTAVSISLFTFVLAKALARTGKEKSRKAIFASGVLLLVAIWLAFRYAGEGFLFPLGISFYTFQAIAYLTEVYWEEEAPETSVWHFMLYMLLFMKFLSGPIERPGTLLPQLRQESSFNYPMVVYGLKLILIGLVKKLVLADNISPYIDGVFSSVHEASGVQLLMAFLLYPIELYADFSGYTDMAIGVASMFGIRLSPNFDRPFIARTTSDFWRRWHMSLSFWVRDYVYLPLTAETRRWGQWGIFFSLIVTFVALGVWHGAGWNFAIYGLLQGLILCYEMKVTVLRNGVEKWLGKGAGGFVLMLRTYLLFAFSLLFFRLKSVSEALYFINHISFRVHHSWKEINIGMPDHTCIVAGSTLALIWLYEYFSAKSDLLNRLEEQPAWVRWCVYYTLVFAILTTGKFGSDNFIYLQF